MERLFFCYSHRFKRALVANGFTPIGTGLNRNTGNIFWLFWGTPEFNHYKDCVYQNERDKF